MPTSIRALSHAVRLCAALAGWCAARPVLLAQVPTSPPDSAAPSRNPRVAQPERPTVATHAYVVAPGYVEIEAGGALARPGTTSTLQFPVTVKFGTGGRTQLELAESYARVDAGTARYAGVGDLTAALKWRVTRDDAILGDLSIQPAVILPVGPARTTGTGTVGASLLLISSRKLGVVELDANLGATERSGNGTRVPRTATVWAASFSGPLTDRMGWAAELFGFPGTSGPAGGPPAEGTTLALTWAVHPWLVLDAGFIGNLAHLPANSIVAGATWNVGRL